MKRCLLAALACLAALPLYAQTPTVRYVPLGYQQITLSGGATFLTVPTEASGTQGPVCAIISVETAAVRYRDDGTAPTASVGFPLAVTGANQPLTYCGQLSAIQFIQQAGSATLNVLYYRISG